MTTVAVTGASGKLGRHVVRVLHKDGYRGVALDPGFRIGLRMKSYGEVA